MKRLQIIPLVFFLFLLSCKEDKSLTKSNPEKKGKQESRCQKYDLEKSPTGKHNLAVASKLAFNMYESSFNPEDKELMVQEFDEYQLILIQGTNSDKDKRTEANFILKEFSEACASCEVHSGYRELYKFYENKLKRLNKEKPIIMLGHSKGATLALLFQFLLKEHKIHHVYAFSPAKFGNKSLFKQAEGNDVSIIVAAGDPVPSLPFSEKEITEAKEIHSIEDKTYEILKNSVSNYNYQIAPTILLGSEDDNHKDSVSFCVKKLADDLELDPSVKTKKDLVEFLQTGGFDFQENCYTSKNHSIPYQKLYKKKIFVKTKRTSYEEK